MRHSASIELKDDLNGHICTHTGEKQFNVVCGKGVTQNNTLNTLRPRQNGRHFADDIFKWIFLNENV